MTDETVVDWSEMQRCSDIVAAVRVVMDISAIEDARDFYFSWTPTERAAWDVLAKASGRSSILTIIK